jgi:hypothetical protein
VALTDICALLSLVPYTQYSLWVDAKYIMLTASNHFQRLESTPDTKCTADGQQPLQQKALSEWCGCSARGFVRLQVPYGSLLGTYSIGPSIKYSAVLARRQYDTTRAALQFEAIDSAH